MEGDDTSTDPLPASSQATINITEPDEATPSSQAQLDASTTTSSSSPKPDLPPRPHDALSQRALSPTPPALSAPTISNATSHSEDDREREDEYNYDAVSVLSTSSRSARFGSVKSNPAITPLRKRATDTSSRRGGGRRASDAVEEEDAAALGTQLGLSLGSESDKGWGVGDELRMGLE
jgi:hypothetical protein